MQKFKLQCTLIQFHFLVSVLMNHHPIAWLCRTISDSLFLLKNKFLLHWRTNKKREQNSFYVRFSCFLVDSIHFHKPQCTIYNSMNKSPVCCSIYDFRYVHLNCFNCFQSSIQLDQIRWNVARASKHTLELIKIRRMYKHYEFCT